MQLSELGKESRHTVAAASELSPELLKERTDSWEEKETGWSVRGGAADLSFFFFFLSGRNLLRSIVQIENCRPVPVEEMSVYS